MFETIDSLTLELAQFKNNQRPQEIKKWEKSLHDGFVSSIKEFLESDKQISIFELPDVSNTVAALEYTRWFFNVLFKIAKHKKNFGKRVCIVLEEAHTVVPEYNFLGVSDKSSQHLVNSIGQIALQGRKYDIGFMVIAQRTANVSKTILTQCNSIIAFQQFDRTSSDFLSAYMGRDLAEALPRLKPRHAVAVGKAFKANIPMIFKVPDIEEPEIVQQQEDAPSAPESDTGEAQEETGLQPEPRIRST